MDVFSMLIQLGVVGFLWKIATELSCIKMSLKYLTERVGWHENRLTELEKRQ